MPFSKIDKIRKIEELTDGLDKIKSIISKLNHKESELANFFYMSKDLLTIAADGYFQIVNDAWTIVTGFSAEELTSEPFISFIHPDDITKTVMRAMAIVPNESTPYNFINRYRCKSGGYITLSWSSIKMDDGVIFASARLLNYYEIMFNLTEDMLAIIDEFGKFKLINSKWSENLGYSELELAGIKGDAYIHPDDLELSREEGKKFSEGLNTHVILRFKHKGGYYLPIEFWGKKVNEAIYLCARVVK